MNRSTLPAILLLSAFRLVCAQDMPADIETAFVAKVKAVLPELTVKLSGRNSVPDGWETFDKVGVFVEGEIKSKPFKIWLLPKDWIGIRIEDADKQHPVYWEGVLEGAFEGERYKTITDCEDEVVHQAISKGLSMYTESLVNGGWHNTTNVFKDRADEATERRSV